MAPVARSLLRILPVLAFLAASPASAQVFIGTVVEEGSGASVAGALVSVLPAGADTVLVSALSDDQGRFSVRIPRSGRYRLRVEHLAFGTLVTQAHAMGRDQVVRLELELGTEPVTLAPLNVEAERLEPPYMRDIRDRIERGRGKFLTRQELAPLGSSRLRETLSLVPGLFITERRGPSGLPTLQIETLRGQSGGGTGSCFATIFVNGARVYDMGAQRTGAMFNFPDKVGEDRLAFLAQLTAEEVEAVEVYRGVAELPAEYGGSGSNCGVVALWLRSSMDALPEQRSGRRRTFDLAGGLGTAAAGGSVGGLSGPGVGWAAQLHWRWTPQVWLGTTLGSTWYSVGAAENTGFATVLAFEPRWVRSHGSVRPFGAVRAGVARRRQRPVQAEFTSWGFPLGVAGGVLVATGRRETFLELAGVWERTSWGPLRITGGPDWPDSREVWSSLGVRVMMVRTTGQRWR